VAVVPALVFGLFLMLPHFRSRFLMLAAYTLVLVFAIGLGMQAKVDTDRLRQQMPSQTETDLPGLAIIGQTLFRNKCANCHREPGTNESKPGTGPDFIRLASKQKNAQKKEDLIFYLIAPRMSRPQTIMPTARQLQLSLKDVEALAEFCMLGEFRATRSQPSMKTEAKILALSSVIKPMSRPLLSFNPGRRVFQNECMKCHALNGSGGKSGMPEFVTGKNAKQRVWIEALLANPSSVFPGTMMPAAEARGAQRDALIDFVRTIKIGRVAPGKKSLRPPSISDVPANGSRGILQRLDELTVAVRSLDQKVNELALRATPPQPRYPS
jgi:mono/diheme cytochrome c family protein